MFGLGRHPVVPLPKVHVVPRRCEHCAYRVETSCYRFPPLTIMEQVHTGHDDLGQRSYSDMPTQHRPIVAMSDWCGEFMPSAKKKGL